MEGGSQGMCLEGDHPKPPSLLAGEASSGGEAAQTQDMLAPGEPGRSVRGVMSGSRTRRTGCWGGLLKDRSRGECRGPCRVQGGCF